MKLEVGSHATAWAGTPLELEEFRCRRTFQRLPVSTGTTSVLLAVGQRIGGTMIDLPVAVPVSLRADPIIVTSGFAWSNGSPSGNQVSFFNNSAANWASLTGALTLTSVTLPSVSGVVLRFQAGTSFSGVAGAVGHLHFGSQAFIALQAEP